MAVSSTKPFAWLWQVRELSVVMHSMGGLLIRSAVHCAQQGAPLELAGNWVDVILGTNPFSKPFVNLGQLRSAGITDLRYGHVLDADWQGHDRFKKRSDSRQPLPLPLGVAYYTVACCTARR